MAEQLDSTCGYVSGVQSLSFTCSQGLCGFNPALSAVGCCSRTAPNNPSSLTDCSFQTICYSSIELATCTPSCTEDPLALLCTDPAAPYCARYTFTDVGSAGLYCDTASVDVPVARTYVGQQVTSSRAELTFGPSATPSQTAKGPGGQTTSTDAAEGGTTTTKPPTTSRAGGAGFVVPNPFTKSQIVANNGGSDGQGNPSAPTGTKTSGAAQARSVVRGGWMGVGVAALVVGALIA